MNELIQIRKQIIRIKGVATQITINNYKMEDGTYKAICDDLNLSAVSNNHNSLRHLYTGDIPTNEHFALQLFTHLKILETI